MGGIRGGYGREWPRVGVAGAGVGHVWAGVVGYERTCAGMGGGFRYVDV